jgi:hypothetical protein
MSVVVPETDNPYPEYFKEIYEAQEARKQSLETRAAAIIGVSGTVVTFIFVIAGLATKSSQTFSLTKDARWYLYAALISLVASTIIAILAALPLVYKAVQADGLRWVVESAWDEPADDAALRIAATRASNLAWNKGVNDLKALILVLALAAQITAVVFLALAAWEILSVADLAPTSG